MATGNNVDSRGQSGNDRGGAGPAKASSADPAPAKTSIRFLLSLSWKNLSRHRKRTYITASAIAFGLGMYIFMDAWLLGAELDSMRNLQWYETSSARVHAQGYWEIKDRLPLSRLIENHDGVEDSIRSAGYPATPRVSFAADLIVREDPYPNDGSMQVRAFAIDTATDEDVFRLSQHVEKGSPLTAGDPGVLIGVWLAEDLGADVGYPLTLVTRTRDGYFQTLDLEVRGILNTPNPVLNRGTVYLPLDVADEALQLRGGVTEIDIRMPDQADSHGIAGRLENTVAGVEPGLEVYPWQEIASDFIAIATAKRGGSGLMLFLVFIIAAVGISNTMLMVVFERTRELGTLRAIGMSNRDIRMNFLMEAGGIGFLGALGGLILGSVLTAVVTYVGMDFTWMLRDMDIGYRLAGKMYGAWHPEAMVAAFFLGILITVLVAWFPTRRALRMSVTDCLRED